MVDAWTGNHDPIVFKYDENLARSSAQPKLK